MFATSALPTVNQDLWGHADADAWVAAARAGDREALDRFLGSIERRVYVFAYRLMGDPSLAEDVTQEALLRVCRRLDSYRLGTNLWGWIYRIVVNQACDARRTRARFTALTEEHHAPVEDFAQRERMRRVLETLDTLTEKERVALVLIDMEGMTSHEAAAVMGCLTITARTRASQARRKVRERLARFYPELQEGS